MEKFPVTILREREVPSNKDYLKLWGGKKNIDIGCGPRKEKGYIGLDIMNLKNVDIVHDLNSIPWPVKTESADLIIASHIIEHVDSVIPFMTELYRILKPNGKLVVRYPHFSQRHAFTDPTHRRYLTLESLDFFIYNAEQFGTFTDFGFHLIRKCLNADNDVAYSISRLSSQAYEKYWCRIFPACQVVVELKKGSSE